MLEGLGEVITRVQQLRAALGASTPPPVQSSESAKTSQAGTFRSTLAEAQASRPPEPRLEGTTGATQMPGSASSLPASAAGMSLAGLGSGGGFGLLSGLGGGLGLGGLLGDTAATGDAASTQSDSAGSSGLGGLGGLLDGVASKFGVNPALAKAVAQVESNLNPNAVSSAGAQGLMQLMPGTFSAYAGRPGNAPSGAPVSGHVAQPFGPTTFAGEPPLDWNGRHYDHFHTGVDFAVPPGTPIRATMMGTVELRSDPGGFGNLIVVRNGPWDVLYGHTAGHPSEIRTGVTVQPGQVIGYAGSTGNSTGPHVHYEIRHDGQPIDPAPFLQSGTSSASPYDPVANATAGVGYLKDLLTRFHNDVPAALAAYNAGPAAVEKYGGVPPYPETQAYVQKALQYARDFSA